MVSLIIVYSSNAVKCFSDKVIQARNFSDEGSFTAFEIERIE